MYDALGRRGQVRRLREAVAQSLRLSGLSTAQCRVIEHQHNTSFRHVDGAGVQTFVRVSRMIDRSPEAIAAEAEWLFELAQAGQPVTVPLQWSNGRFERVIEGSSIGQPRVLTRFKWCKGRHFRNLSATQWETIGQTMAHFHEHTKDRTDLGKGRWEVDGAIGNAGTPEVARQQVRTALGQDALDILDRTLAAYRELRADLGSPQLIHGDLHNWNVLFDGDDFTVLDFDDCGFAPAHYDFSVPIREMTDAERPVAQSGLLRGYESVRPLPRGLLEHLGLLLDYRTAQLVIWIVGERENPSFHNWWKDWCRKQLDALSQKR